MRADAVHCGRTFSSIRTTSAPRRASGVLNELAKKTQVLFFTHHDISWMSRKRRLATPVAMVSCQLLRPRKPLPCGRKPP